MKHKHANGIEHHHDLGWLAHRHSDGPGGTAPRVTAVQRAEQMMYHLHRKHRITWDTLPAVGIIDELEKIHATEHKTRRLRHEETMW